MKPLIIKLTSKHMHNRFNLKAWLLMLPALSFLIAFTHWPTLKSIWRSFTWAKSDVAPSQFVGLENYQLLLEDPVFLKVIENNFWYAIEPYLEDFTNDQLVSIVEGINLSLIHI